MSETVNVTGKTVKVLTGLASEKGLYSSNPGGAVFPTCVTDGSWKTEWTDLTWENFRKAKPQIVLERLNQSGMRIQILIYLVF